MKNPLRNSNNWMGDENEVLKGFSFRSGSKSINTEMVIWSDVFLYSNNQNEKVAIILMDTQGFFENGDTTFSVNSRTFIFSAIISSVLILNLDNQLKIEQIKYLLMTTTFSKNNLEYHQTPFIKSFQNINFIMRNWSNIQQYPWGFNSDNKYIMKSIEHIGSHSNMTHIKSSFKDINSFLLPFPGPMIRLKKSTGCWSQMDVEYKKQLKLLIEHILGPNNLIIRKINRDKITGSGLNEKIKTHFKAIKFKLFTDTFLKVYEQKLAKNYGETKLKDMLSFKNSHLTSKTSAIELATKTDPNLVSILDKAFNKAYESFLYNQDKFNELNVIIEGGPTKHMYGEAFNVMCYNNDNNELNINYTTVSSLMEHSIIKDRKVVVLSMIGFYRYGKSAFMDYCLRYLYAHVSKLLKLIDNNFDH